MFRRARYEGRTPETFVGACTAARVLSSYLRGSAAVFGDRQCQSEGDASANRVFASSAPGTTSGLRGLDEECRRGALLQGALGHETPVLVDAYRSVQELYDGQQVA